MSCILYFIGKKDPIPKGLGSNLLFSLEYTNYRSNLAIAGAIFMANRCSVEQKSGGYTDMLCQFVTSYAINSIEDLLAKQISEQLSLGPNHEERVRVGVSALTYAMIAYFKGEYLPVRYSAPADKEIGLRAEVGHAAVADAHQSTVRFLHAKQSTATNELPMRIVQRCATVDDAYANNPENAEVYNPFKDIAVEKVSL